MSRHDDNFFFDFLVPIVVIVSVVFLIFYGIFSLAEGSAHNDCHDKGDIAQVEVTYREWDGCYVNQSGLWVPFDVWKYNRDHNIKMN